MAFEASRWWPLRRAQLALTTAIRAARRFSFGRRRWTSQDRNRSPAHVGGSDAHCAVCRNEQQEPDQIAHMNGVESRPCTQIVLEQGWNADYEPCWFGTIVGVEAVTDVLRFPDQPSFAAPSEEAIKAAEDMSLLGPELPRFHRSGGRHTRADRRERGPQLIRRTAFLA